MPEPKLPTHSQAILFASKVRVLRVKRRIQNLLNPVPRLAQTELAAEHVLARSTSDLWTESDPAEQRLQLGKVHNLRLVCRAVDGLVLRPGEVFSFWRQVGNPTRLRGFVPGRQIQEGCVIPAIGGGICQLSNALYACALESGCEIVERHPHTRSLSRSSPSFGKDATVAWNHIDLRFRATAHIRIFAQLTRETLEVKFMSDEPGPARSPATRGVRLIQHAESCETCGQGDCFRHDNLDRTRVQPKTAYVLNQVWPEFAGYLNQQRGLQDALFFPIDGQRWKRPGYCWPVVGPTSEAKGLYMLKAIRCRGLSGAALRAATMEFDARIGDYLGSRLPLEASHVVVAMSLLPHLWRAGWLGGRSFDVLADQLPINEIQRLLDAAYEAHPERGLLADFRAPEGIAAAEKEALSAADRIITPSEYVAGLFGERSLLLPWSPARASKIESRGLVAFPGPTAARKGAYEVREAARRLGFTVALSGSELEGRDFWEGVSTVRAGTNWMDGCRAVVQPAIVEEQPRKLLQALASGVPVITTAVCGMGKRDGVTTIPAGDVDALVAAIQALS